MELNKLRIENFKGIKSFVGDFDGTHSVIEGKNGAGKTSVYDAFLWLLFGKDSQGKSDFEVRPEDSNNNPIKGLVLCVEADISFDGTIHTFKKEHHEKVVKGQLRGYETLCWIDEVPKKISDYSKYLAGLITEDTFKMVTNLKHFSEDLHWKERRAVLLDIAGEIGAPTGFDELLATLNGRTLDEYKKVLSEQKKRHTEECKEINPRIDELQKGLDVYACSDTAATEKQRDNITAEIAAIDKERKGLLDSEKQRQETMETINALKSDRAGRERRLANDTTGIQKLLDLKAEITTKLAATQEKVTAAEAQLRNQNALVTEQQDLLTAAQRRLNDARSEYKAASESQESNTCYACKQTLPADKIAEIEAKRKDRLTEIAERGNALMADVKSITKRLEKCRAELKPSQDNIRNIKAVLREGNEYKAEQFKKLDARIALNETLPPEKDEEWQNLTKEIKALTAGLGRPVSEQLQGLETKRNAKSDELAGLDKALAQADRMADDTARIAELEIKEKTLSGKIANIDAQLNDIDGYKAAESSLIEAAVNSKFAHVKFKLFKQQLNEGLKDCCEAMLDGVTYKGCSYGEKIFVGIDIINVLSGHYDLNVPLFIDNAEGLTLPIEAKSQTIELYARPDVEKLTLKSKETKKERKVA